ncbi:MAG: glycosyltransferase [Hyphomicrobiaceae bacterium]|nr:glycosyltransferase [Hyphomicrobiaceae bacterium]
MNATMAGKIAPHPSGLDGLRGKSCVIVAGSIAPYTNRLYDAFAEASGVELAVLCCAAVEPQRAWRLPKPSHYEIKTLDGWRQHRSYTSHVYFNPSIISELVRRRPTAVMVAGFSPTMVLAAAYAAATRTPLGVMTDGSVETDPGRNSLVHWWMRRLIIPRAAAATGASANSLRLLESYGLKPGRGFVLPIVTPWEPPEHTPAWDERNYDILFCGALNEDIKGARFFSEVVTRCKELTGNIRVRIVGDGPLRSELEARFEAAGIPARFDGFLHGAEVAAAYGSAKLLLFPSRGDAWGLVASEAVALGTPVIGSPHAVSSHELIARHGVGRMCEMNTGLWAKTVADILGDQQTWTEMHMQTRQARASFELDKSVRALTSALHRAHGHGPGCPKPSHAMSFARFRTGSDTQS